MSGNLDAERRAFITAGLSRHIGVERDDGSVDCVSPLEDSVQKCAHLESYSKSAMACRFELLFNMHQYRQAAMVSLRAFELIDRFESQLSIYRPDSEVSQVNRVAAERACRVDSRISDLLRTAREIYSQTSGAFDITCGPFWEVWGFRRRQGRIPEDHEIEQAAKRTGMADVVLNEKTSEIRFHNPHVQLNFGGIGKGFAVDHVSLLLCEQGIENYVLHAGQSSVLARGACQAIDRGGPLTAGWKIGLSHPTNPDCRLAEINLVNTALATSGTQRQGFFYQGRRFGHIIDPRTGYPTDHVLSSTVICASAARADALATAFFVMSLNEIQTFCDNHRDVQAVIVMPGRKQANVTLESFNMDDDNWKAV